jgi:hypothetical protein
MRPEGKSVGRTCTVCASPHRATIDAALITGRSSRDLAAQYGLSHHAVSRHFATHLPQAQREAYKEQEAQRADDLLSEARRLREITMALLGRAVQANDLRTALVAVREARGNLELIGKLLGELDTGPAISVMVSAEWAAVRSTLLAALAPHPAARADVARALLALEHGEGNGHRS